MLAFHCIWAALVLPALAKLGTGGECRTSDDCCRCDTSTDCALECHPDTSSTTGGRCSNGGDITKCYVSNCYC
ncbi:unnamed protein product [Cercospora beticola]|nr:unnamed protein product [Cercospora beticola]